MPKLSKEFRADLTSSLRSGTSTRDRESYYAVLIQFREWCQAHRLSLFVELRSMLMARMELPESLIPAPDPKAPSIRKMPVIRQIAAASVFRKLDYVRHDTNQRFGSLDLAAAAVGVSREGFRYNLHRNLPMDGTIWSKVPRDQIRRDSDGKTFPSIGLAARAAGCSYPTMAGRLTTGNPIAGSTWSILPDTAVLQKEESNP